MEITPILIAVAIVAGLGLLLGLGLAIASIVMAVPAVPQFDFIPWHKTTAAIGLTSPASSPATAAICLETSLPPGAHRAVFFVMPFERAEA